jgi:hypothetical protein
MDNTRFTHLETGLAELPRLKAFGFKGRNGEELATDEAAVWKRVLAMRVAKWLKPRAVVETHPGLGVGTSLYRWAVPGVRLLTAESYATESHSPPYAEIVDIDPFGQPWDALRENQEIIRRCKCLMVSNGEALAVRRNLRRAQRFPTKYFGKRLPLWVAKELIPRVERVSGLRVQFFYAFPTSVRLILGRTTFPSSLWRGCPQWMWWLANYAPNEARIER